MTDASTRLAKGDAHIGTSATPSTEKAAVPPAASTVILPTQPFPVAAMLMGGCARPAASQDVSSVSAIWISVDANITCRLSCTAHHECALAVASHLPSSSSTTGPADASVLCSHPDNCGGRAVVASANEACLLAGTPFQLPKSAGSALTTRSETFAATHMPHCLTPSASTQASMHADDLHYLTLPFM